MHTNNAQQQTGGGNFLTVMASCDQRRKYFLLPAGRLLRVSMFRSICTTGSIWCLGISKGGMLQCRCLYLLLLLLLLRFDVHLVLLQASCLTCRQIMYFTT